MTESDSERPPTPGLEVWPVESAGKIVRANGVDLCTWPSGRSVRPMAVAPEKSEE